MNTSLQEVDDPWSLNLRTSRHTSIVALLILPPSFLMLLLDLVGTTDHPIGLKVRRKLGAGQDEGGLAFGQHLSWKAHWRKRHGVFL